MPITFHTENLNKQMYRQMIWNVLINYKLKGSEFYDFMTFWDIHIHPLTYFEPDHLAGYATTSGEKVNFKMAWGMTGKNRIDLYLDDTKGHMYGMQNSTVVQHELAHARLFGTELFVKGVHDNVFQTFTISFWYRDYVWWRKMKVRCIDIRPFLE